MRTSELIGPALNWAVQYAKNGRKPVDYVEARDNFSTSWNKGGPIIEREEIEIGLAKEYDKWFAAVQCPVIQFGPTPLVAAMRCYVASKLGDEVDIPEELL